MTVAIGNQTILGNGSNISYLMWYLITAPPFILPTKPSIPEVYGVSGEKAALPCNRGDSQSNKNIRLVLWYRDDTKTPFYTLDARKTASGKITHFVSPELSARFSLDFLLLPLRLHIDPVRLTDDGIYHCRIEFTESPTETFLVRLRVIVPPGQIKILNELGEQVSETIGPYDENSNLTLKCISTGGLPLPALTWWQEVNLIDSDYAQKSENIVENDLNIANLNRQHYRQKYSCISSNNNISLPLSSSVIIEMNLKPLDVRITTPKSPLFVNWKALLECESSGSRPPALLSWWLDGLRIASANETFLNNATKSKLLIVPTTQDDGKELLCKAGNPAMPGSVIENGWTLLVFYIPELSVSFGHNIDSEMVREGLDIYFECHIRANPKAEDVKWFFGRQQLYSNASAGVILSNQSLALQKVKKYQTGRYQCSASNEVGEGWSDPIYLQVKYPPRCSQTKPEVLALSPDETIRISCEVDANPPVETFYWTLHHSGFVVDLQSSSSSYISFNLSRGYGVIKCWGINVIGDQVKPCELIVMRKDSRRLLKNCDLTDVGEFAFLVTCERSSEQNEMDNFHLEIYDSPTRNMLANLTSRGSPSFLVEDLQNFTQISLVLYASSSNGRTEVMNLVKSKKLEMTPLSAPGDQQKSSLDITKKNFVLLLSIVFCTLVVFGIMGLALGIALKRKCRFKDEDAATANTRGRTQPSRCNNDEGPDLVQNTSTRELDTSRTKNEGCDSIELSYIPVPQEESC